MYYVKMRPMKINISFSKFTLEFIYNLCFDIFKHNPSWSIYRYMNYWYIYIYIFATSDKYRNVRDMCHEIRNMYERYKK